MADESTLDELRWMVNRYYQEFCDAKTATEARLAGFVLLAVYHAERDSDRDRIGRLEDAAEQARARAHTALWTALAAVVGAVITVIANAIIGGGHP